MITTTFEYFSLNILLLLTFSIAGWLISKSRSVYWKYANWCIIAFTLIQGCRYARGNDYFAYSNFFRLGIHEGNPFFAVINNALKFIGFNEYSCFLFYSFVFVFCGLIFLKDYRKYAKYLFPLFIIGFMRFEEYMIRQAFSYSFFFIYLKYLRKIQFEDAKLSFPKIKNRYLLYCILAIVLILSIHTANIINILVVTSLFFFYPYPFTPLIAIPTYVLCVYVVPGIFDFSILQPALDFIAENNEHAASYVKDADHWFSADGYNSIYKKNAISELFQVIGSSSLMFLGYKLIKSKFPTERLPSVFLNTFIIGICIESAFNELEILNRIGFVLDLLGFIVLGFVLYYKPLQRNLFYKLCYLSLTWFLYNYLKYLFMPDKTMFIWDTHYSFF